MDLLGFALSGKAPSRASRFPFSPSSYLPIKQHLPPLPLSPLPQSFLPPLLWTSHVQLKDTDDTMTAPRARALHAAGITNLDTLAMSVPEDIQRALAAALPRNMRGVQSSLKAKAGIPAK